MFNIAIRAMLIAFVTFFVGYAYTVISTKIHYYNAHRKFQSIVRAQRTTFNM